jgi:predicted Rossmann fold nucleotide-binding protein DprA/Smf involved in DNA uptake
VFDARHCGAPFGAAAEAVRLARKCLSRTATAIGRVRTACATAQAICKKEAFKRAEKELAAIRAIPGCKLVNWSEPEYPQTLLQIYDPPVLLYVRGDAQILNAPSLAVVGTGRPTLLLRTLKARIEHADRASVRGHGCPGARWRQCRAPAR